MDYEDDVDVREQMFHNAVREYIVSSTSGSGGGPGGPGPPDP